MSEPLPPRQRWADAAGDDPAALAASPVPLLRQDEPMLLIGGKLAAALAGRLRAAGFTLVAAEKRHPLLADLPPEAEEYEAFGNGYGEVHSARAFRQLIERAARTFAPAEDRWHEGALVVDPFRPALRYPAASEREFDVLTERHLNTVRSALRRAAVVVVALSTSEVWEATADGTVFPHWTDAGARFNAERHAVRTLTVEETVADLAAGVWALQALNPEVRTVLMVSPEPQPATAQPAHIRVADALGKAVLRIGIEAAARIDGVRVFPALEIAALRTPAGDYPADGSVPAAVVSAVADGLIAAGAKGADGAGDPAAPIAVVGFEPVKPEPVEELPALAPAKEEAAPRGRRGRKKDEGTGSPGVSVSVVDPYSVAKAAEDREKEMLRAAKRTADMEARAAEVQATRAARLADIEAAKQAKIAAREDALAAKQAAREQRLAGTPATGGARNRAGRSATPAPTEEVRVARKPRTNADGETRSRGDRRRAAGKGGTNATSPGEDQAEAAGKATGGKSPRGRRRGKGSTE